MNKWLGIGARLTSSGSFRRNTIISLFIAQVVASIVAIFSPLTAIALTGVILVAGIGLLIELSAEGGERVEAIGSSIPAEIADAVKGALNTPPGIVAAYDSLMDAPWETLLPNSSRIEIVSSFFSFLTEDRRGQALVQFFKSGGKIDVYAIDPSAIDLYEYASATRDPMRREGRTDFVRDLALSSIKHLDSLREAAGRGPDAINVYSVNTPIYYVGIGLDRETLLFGAYEQRYVAIARCPRFRIDLADNRPFREFWASEMDLLSTGTALSAADFIDEFDPHD